MQSAYMTAWSISKWVIPEKFFVAFPMAMYNIYDLRPHRLEICDSKHNFFLTYNDMTIRDGLPLPFTMFGTDFKKCRNAINKNTTREYLPPLPGEHMPSRKRPLADRWSARHLSIKEVFAELEIKKTSHKMILEWYYDMSNWSEYCNFLGSDNNIETPEKLLTNPHRHDKMCIEKGEE